MGKLNLDHIQGWFDFEDIYTNAVDMASDKDIFVEIGAYLGKSTIYMANEILNSKKKIFFYVIDSFIGEPSENNENLYEKYLVNISKYGVDKIVNTIKSDSKIAFKKLPRRKISFLFIDGDHSFEGIKKDIVNYYPLVKKGGIIAGHDYYHPPIKKMVDEYFGDKVQILNNSWLVKK